MNKLMFFQRPEPTPLAAAQTALRDLYRAARQIPYHAPYAAARLARIADQAEYFLQEWPAELWPTVLPSAWPVPTKAALITWLITAKTEAECYRSASGQPWTYAAWRRISTLLLAALVPFS